MMQINMTELQESLSKNRIPDVEFLKRTCQPNRKMAAVHHACADGLSAGAILKAQETLHDVLIIPLDYTLLKNNILRPFLQSFSWEYIVDLEPFNLKRGSLFVDHHESVIGRAIHFEKIIFDARAPSATWLLATKVDDFKISPKLEELAKLTVITDTAGFTIPPPNKVFMYVDGLTEQEKAWALADAAATVRSIEDALRIIDNLSEDGIEGLVDPPIIDAINEHRRLRAKALELAREAEIDDITIVIVDSNEAMPKSIVYDILERGGKVGIALTQDQKITRISLRLSKQLAPEEIQKYRVDLLARQMNGGGHPPAAGAATQTLDEALTKIDEWAKSKGLSMVINDFRGRI